MKKFPEFVTTFLSYYLASTAITAFIMLTVFSFFIDFFDKLPKNLYFIITLFLYYLLLFVLTLLYYPHRKARNYQAITLTAITIIYLHKLVIGNLILNTLHFSICSIVLANIVVAYLSDKDAHKIALIELIIIGSIIYFVEAICNNLLFFYNTTNHGSNPQSILEEIQSLILSQLKYYLGYLLAIYAFYLTYPLIKNFRLKISDFEVVFDVLKILLAPVGVIAILLALVFA